MKSGLERMQGYGEVGKPRGKMDIFWTSLTRPWWKSSKPKISGGAISFSDLESCQCHICFEVHTAFFRQGCWSQYLLKLTKKTTNFKKAMLAKGRLYPRRLMNFGKLPRGGEVIPDPKKFVADFSILNEHFSFLNFWKRGGHSNRIF